ncbi:MAG: outer membrane protein transport protein [Elusimicrobiota bacterium]
MRNTAILAIVLAMAGNAGAAGYRLAEQDAKATGMGNSFVAVADNASAAWYNPAAIIGLEGTNLSLGSVMVAPSMDHKNEVGATSTDKIENVLHVPPHFYATRKMTPKIAVGLSVNAPFGLSTSWDKLAANTREIATKSEIQAIYTNLNGVYKVNDALSVAAGASYVSLDATMNKKVEFGTTNVEQTLKGDGNGVGFNVAGLYKWNKWQFGTSYRSAVKIDVDGKINLPTTGTTLAALAANNRNAKTTITMPDMFQLGASYKYSDTWLFSGEADYTNWTTYRRLIIDYTRNTGAAAQTIDNKNWTSVWALRAGTEYKVSDAWKARAGIFYDWTPVTEKYFETRVPDADRLAFSIGAGYTKGNITVDASYMYLKFMERKIDSSIQDDGATIGGNYLNGKYNASAMLPAITVSYKF